MSRRVVPPRRKEITERERIANLAAILDIGPKALKKLERKHGAKLEATLERWHKETRERPRFMAKQQGRVLRDQYVETAVAAIDDAEAVPEDDQRIITMTAHARWAEHEQHERAQETARREVRSLTSQVKQTAIEMSRAGADPTPLFIEIRRAIDAHRRRAA